MVRRRFSPREVSRALDTKVCDVTRSVGEVNCWVIIDGQKVFRVTRPQTHKGDLPTGKLNSIRNQARLRWEEFEQLVACSLSRDDYHDLMRKQRDSGLL